MDSKENILDNNNPLHASFVKSEPQDHGLAPLAEHQTWNGVPEGKPIVKPEIDAGPEGFGHRLPELHAIGYNPSHNVVHPPKKEEPAVVPVPQPAPERSFFTAHNSAAEIEYTPENALKEGLGMVKTLQANIKKLELGSKLRQDVWEREIQSLLNQTTPSTMIAVCGATGAGKSSIMNAILDDNIVPTSGMRACTAVVTEIGYHNKKTIEGFVSFLTEHEWRQELSVLLDDLVDEDGNLKRITNDMRSEASVAWSKVHAVYPSITQEQLAKMSVNEIIGRDANIAKMLGTTKHIIANDSKQFAKEIGKFIDSKDQKRGDKSKKDKAKPKDQPKSIMERLREANKKNTPGSASSSKSNDNMADDPNGPAFWPLIRQVQVKCNSRALSTGCILVDLPGVADANAARNNIAKDYMKKCDCIWVLAPITRAVDDKTARDLMGDAFKMQLMNGNYDDNAITFIATKCDDISCTEVIRALNLEDDPELERIEDEIDQCKTEMQDWQEKKSEAEEAAKAANENLKEVRPILAEYQEHLKALQKGDDFTPVLTGKAGKSKKETKTKSGDEDEDMSEVEDLVGDDEPRGKKRKHTSGGKTGSSKKRRVINIDDDDDDDFIVDDDDELIFTDDDDDVKSSANGPDTSDQGSDSENEKDEDENMDKEEEEEEPVTEESLKAKIQEAQELVTQFRTELSSCREQRKTAMDALATLKKRENKAQREKNAFCSRKRSEFSKDVLKEDFRVGLKDLDDAAAEQRDPDNFDPTINIRDYDAIDLPVFTCSARDYIRIKGQVKGDGDPSCFTKVEDTGIPALQEWCHHLTVSSRERAARNFLIHLKTFANTVKTYVQGVGDVTAADREALRAKWESNLADYMDEDEEPMAYDGGWANAADPFSIEGLAMLADPQARAGLYAVEKKPKLNRHGDLVGVTPRLIKEFATVVDNCVHELQERFKDGLEEKCRVGAANAAAAAVETHDTFAYKSGIHWATYRATLRRHGCWRGDLNTELCNPFTRQIASTWSKVFEGDLFAAFEKGTNDAIMKILKEVEETAAPGLKERARGTMDVGLEEARTALKKTIELVRETINTEQKEVSRLLSPHVMNQLAPGYDLAMLERGTGSVARQKCLFSEYIGDRCKDDNDNMFEGAANVILSRLAEAAEAVGKTLGNALERLAEKVELSVAVLWEGPRDDPKQSAARAEVVNSVSAIIEEVERWQQAAEAKAAAEGPAARPADA